MLKKRCSIFPFFKLKQAAICNNDNFFVLLQSLWFLSQLSFLFRLGFKSDQHQFSQNFHLRENALIFY